MRPERLSPMHLLFIVSLSTVMFSACLTWAQEMSSGSKASTQVSILAPHSVADPEVIRFNPAYEKLSLPFASSQGQTPSLVRFGSLDLGYRPSFSKDNALPDLWRSATLGETQAKASHFVSNAPTEWLTYPNPQNTVHYRAPDWGDALQHYGQRIPWAGRIMLGVGKQARFHPRVFRIFELIDPGLSLGKPPSYHR